jgi:hypothetical protein
MISLWLGYVNHCLFEIFQLSRSSKATTSSVKWQWHQKPTSHKVVLRIKWINKYHQLKMVSAYSQYSIHISYIIIIVSRNVLPKKGLKWKKNFLQTNNNNNNNKKNQQPKEEIQTTAPGKEIPFSQCTGIKVFHISIWVKICELWLYDLHHGSYRADKNS